MKLRIARKIIMSSDEDKTRYTENQLQRAYYRWEKSKGAKETNNFIHELMTSSALLGLRTEFSRQLREYLEAEEKINLA